MYNKSLATHEGEETFETFTKLSEGPKGLIGVVGIDSLDVEGRNKGNDSDLNRRSSLLVNLTLMPSVDGSFLIEFTTVVHILFWDFLFESPLLLTARPFKKLE